MSPAWLLVSVFVLGVCAADPGSRQGWVTFAQNAQRHSQSSAIVNLNATAASSFTIGTFVEKMQDRIGAAPSPLVTPDGNWYLLVPDSDAAEYERYVLVLFSPSTNAVVASYKYSTSWFPPFIDRAGTVYVADYSEIVALSSDLKEQWHLRLNDDPFTDVLTANFLLSNDDSTAYYYIADTTTSIGKVDLANKKVGWKTQIGFGMAQTDQLELTLSPGGDRVLVIWQDGVFNINVLFAIDAASGKLAWQYDNCSAVFTASYPVAGCGDGSDGGAVYWFCGDYGVMAHNASDGSVLWNNTDASYLPQFAVSCGNGQTPDLLVGASGTGSMLVLDAATGATVGDYAWPDGIVFPTVLGLDANNTLFFSGVSGVDGKTYVYGAAASTGDVVFKVATDPVGAGLVQIAAFTPQGGIVLRTSAGVQSPVTYSLIQ